MKNSSGRNSSFGWQLFVLILFSICSGIAAVILRFRFQADWFWFLLPAVGVIGLLILITLNVFRGQAGGKIRNLHFVHNENRAYFAAVDSFPVFETDVDYNTRLDVDYFRERVQIVDIRAGRRVFQTSVKSTRANDLKLEGQTKEGAVFQSRNLGRFSLNFSSGVVTLNALKPDAPQTLRQAVASSRAKERHEAFEDKSAVKVDKVQLPDGRTLELRGDGTRKIFCRDTALGDRSYAGAGFLCNDDVDARPIVFGSLPGGLLYHAARVSGRQVLCFSRISTEGRSNWDLFETDLFRRPRTDSGKTKLHSIFGDDEIIVLAYTLPPRWGDLAFGISARTGRPIWKYVF